MRQLIFVDDNVTLVRVMGKALSTNYQVKTFIHPREALVYMEDNNSELDVIISDFKMPGMNGFEVLAKAKMLKPETIRILLTGYAEEGILENKELFCDAILDKNICKSTQDIVNVIDKLTLKKQETP
ncbi:MAG: hypothetical protein A2X42_06710 [Candidatus Margulisbacteria bacterium GWF2_38_17]|nr:MAG: hypothetical protein A2X43_10105 [Candidatus Margulisbacteria bacterium GWD2_39_127]OGI01432.1 MAG: hypothetical protein A2X42_06710 [Candidatus Margulisbacteria bacterium GWF2_38_17]OGI10075.1 MAG: hypothetical protein A2X41_10370 [Candidatus Margulisbacteria bacterium GWE2_39_32]